MKQKNKMFNSISNAGLRNRPNINLILQTLKNVFPRTDAIYNIHGFKLVVRNSTQGLNGSVTGPIYQDDMNQLVRVSVSVSVAQKPVM